jgi:hypothetical protein
MYNDFQLKVSEAEATLLLEMLKHEHDELAVEIHHSRVASFTEDLRSRRAMIENLMQRLEAPSIAQA